MNINNALISYDLVLFSTLLYLSLFIIIFNYKVLNQTSRDKLELTRLKRISHFLAIPQFEIKLYRENAPITYFVIRRPRNNKIYKKQKKSEKFPFVVNWIAFFCSYSEDTKCIRRNYNQFIKKTFKRIAADNWRKYSLYICILLICQYSCYISDFLS